MSKKTKTIETFPSLEQRLEDVRNKFKLHLNKPYLSRLVDNIDESDHTRVVLQAVIMILGYNYMSDRTLYIVFEKESTIKRIKTWNKCKLQKHKVLRIKNWMEFRPQTFGEASGYKGDKLLHALRDWCIIMVANKTKVTKKITNEEREIKTLRGTPKNTTMKTPTENQLKVPSNSEFMTKKATMPKPESVAMAIKVSKVEDKVIRTEQQENDEKQSEEPKQCKNTLKVPITSESAIKKATMRKSVASTKRKKKSKAGSKATQCRVLTMDKAVSSTIASMKIKTEDKSVGEHIEMISVAVQTASKSKKTMHSRANKVHVERAIAMRNSLRGIADNLDENLDILFQAKEELLEAKKDLKVIKSYRNKKIVKRGEMNQTEWDKERGYILQKIADDQERLQIRLKSTQSTFCD